MMKGCYFLSGLIVAVIAMVVYEITGRGRHPLVNYLDMNVEPQRKAIQLIANLQVLPSLATADKLGVFEAISAASPEGTTMKELAAKLSLSEKGLDSLLVTLTTSGYVKTDGSTPSRLTCEPHGGLSERIFLDIQMYNMVMQRQLFHLPEAVRSGRPEGLYKVFGDDVTSLYDARTRDDELSKYWDPWMEAQNDPVPFAKQVDSLMKHSKSAEDGSFMLLDWCGNMGYNAIRAVSEFPTVHATVLDLPAQIAKAAAAIKEKGLEARVDTLPANLLDGTFVPPLATFDGVVMTHTIREWGAEQLRILFRMVYDALKPGGGVLMDMVALRRLGEYPKAPLAAGLHEAYFLVTTAEGQQQHHKDDLISLLTGIGFLDFDWISLPGMFCEVELFYNSEFCHALLARRP